MSTHFTPEDERYMRLALALARRGIGYVEPNPAVGAVVVRNNRIVGQGYHRRFGGPHAEVHALESAGSRAQKATLYVTLEPCCHWGKTPPCTDAILASGISRVVVAMIDPFTKVRGKGIAQLRKQGIRVDVGLLQIEAHTLNAPFITRLTQHRPFVIAKWAQSVDGCIATASGESRWISSESSREFVQKLRGRVDAVLVGIGTALADDPLLMARPARGSDIRRLATRIVIDSHCRLPLTSQLRRTIPFAPLMIAHAKTLDRAAEKRCRLLSECGAIMVPVPVDLHGRLRLKPFLAHLADLDYANILVEGGASLMAAIFRAKLIDELHVFLAPLVIGGSGAIHAVGGLKGSGVDLTRLADAPRFDLLAMRPSGPDIHAIYRPAKSLPRG